MMWTRTHKGDARCRAMADQHYTRQNPGHPMWTRPGYNAVMITPCAAAVWCWWRPKWEHGTPGTQRKDGLRAIECTLFRRMPPAPLASSLIAAAVEYMSGSDAAADLHIDAAGPVHVLITGVSTAKTAGGRSPRSEPGACYRHAGWRPFAKRGGRADVWLYHPFPGSTWDAAARSLASVEAGE
jgi:hypothetical protein